MERLKRENERFVGEDAVYALRYRDGDTGEVVPDPTDFALRFYIKDRRTSTDEAYNEVVCRRQGNNEPAGCSIEAGGYIHCYLPKDTFLPGRLLMEDMITVPCGGFDDGDWESVERYDTGVVYTR